MIADRCADFELRLDPGPGGVYVATTRLSLPGAGRELDPLGGQPAAAAFDAAAFLAASASPDYGRVLGRALFADPRLYAAYFSARTAAEGLQLPLRLRLHIDQAALALHTLRWELLADPYRPDAPLFGGQRLRLCRHIASADQWPYRPPPLAGLRALVAVAAPSSQLRGLAPIDADREAALAARALAGVAVRRAGGPGDPLTLARLVAALDEGADVLYLVCHGAVSGARQSLWLEDEGGAAMPVSADEVVAKVAGLMRRPSLVVLAACQAGGADRGELAALAIGPRLVAAGVPAVVAMHGDVPTTTVERFAPALFRELLRDGQIDRAVAAARAAVHPDDGWWRPALFTSLDECRLWAPAPPAAAGGYPAWRGDSPQRHALCAAIAGLAQLGPPEQRAELVAGLPRGARARLRPEPDPVAHIQQIVDTCLAEPWGVEALADALRDRLGAEPGMARVDAALALWRPQPITLAELAPLKAALAGAPLGDELLMAMFRQAAPGRPAPGHYAERGLLPCLLESLAELSPPALGQHPLARLLDELAPRLGEPARVAVELWRAARADLLGAPQGPPAAPAPRGDDGPPALQIELAPDGAGAYRVQAWLWRREPLPVFVDDRPRPLHQVRGELLLEIYERCVDHLSAEDDERLLVEFFLPRELLGEPVDQWGLGFEDERLGIRYRVAVRLQERAGNRFAWRRWESRWRDLADRARPIPVALLRQVRRVEECGANALRIQLDKAAALALSCGLPDDRLRDDLLRILLSTGTPIALWPRRRLDLAADPILDLLTRPAADSIPAEVFAARQEAYAGDAGHHGHVLTLLWDDFDRLPHQRIRRLAAPSAEGG